MHNEFLFYTTHMEQTKSLFVMPDVLTKPITPDLLVRQIFNDLLGHRHDRFMIIGDQALTAKANALQHVLDYTKQISPNQPDQLPPSSNR